MVMCVCVCVCETKIERKREQARERERQIQRAERGDEEVDHKCFVGWGVTKLGWNDQSNGVGVDAPVTSGAVGEHLNPSSPYEYECATWPPSLESSVPCISKRTVSCCYLLFLLLLLCSYGTAPQWHVVVIY